MAVQQAFKGIIDLAFDYKPSETSESTRIKIEPQRIAYLMIERMYENVNILPIVYVSINLSSEMYTKVMDSSENSKFYLRIRKRDALSKTSIYTTTVEDTFNYVTSSTSANYSAELDSSSNAASAQSFKNIIIGLVSAKMTNKLRTAYNGIYRNIDTEGLVDLALDGLGKTIKQKLKYNKEYNKYLIPPVTSRYKLLSYIFTNSPFYDSNFTFFMDFNATYLVSKNSEYVDDKTGKPNTAIINIKNYTASEAYTDGFTIKNNAYVMYVNAADTQVIANNATEKVSNNIVSYSNSNGVQNLNTNVNSTKEGDDSIKTSFVKSRNAAAIKNELQASSVMIEIMKQNVDPDIFTPNKSYNVSNYEDYNKYDGTYFLSYKREFYYLSQNNEFLVTSNIGLKYAGQEEIAMTKSDSYKKQRKAVTASSSSSKKKSTSNKKSKLSSSLATKK